MKKYLFAMLSVLLFCGACSDDNNDGGYKTYQVAVQVAYPSGSKWSIEELPVKLTDSNGTTYDGATDASGKATFVVPVGIYEASAADKKASEGYAYIYNGIKSGIVVTDQWVDGTSVALDLTESKAGQVLIKELYVGGCQKDDGSGNWHFDKYAILYNNSDQTAVLENLCLGLVSPPNPNSTLNDYGSDGNLVYANDDYIPAGGAGIWYLPRTLTIEPWQQIVVAFNNALNNTLTYSNSVDLSHADYYITYDIDDFNHTSYHPAPSENIPTANYFLAAKFGQGTSWVLSNSGPAVFIFTTHGVSPEELVSDAGNYHYYAGKENNIIYRTVKIPTDWILDGIEVFPNAYLDASKKRFTPAIDGGYTILTNKYGYTSYRNVDKEATEAIAGNSEKLVYNYSLGTLNVSGVENGSTDPSGIDAEASMKNGARIVYQDTNNSTNDFHQRSRASLKD